jgi:carboxymethylenebutenolidase
MPEAHIEIEAEDGCIDAFAVCPDGMGPWRPILLLSDSRGLRPAIEAMARCLAGQGFYVLAPDLFYRTGTGPDAEARHAAVEIVLDPAAQAEDFEAWLSGLEAKRLVDDARVGVLGYGVGAAMALRLAALHAERIAAAAVFYGGRPSADEARHLAACVNAVLHLGHADDGGAGAGALEAALRREGVDFESLAFAAPRGFAVPDHPGYEPEAAERHWTNLLELFRRTLGMSNSDPGDPPERSEGGILPQDAPRSLL